ncbi:MAG: hypothetical protein D6800_00805 [Candidatus Zixiibacteriota bacterium]|nr:MAG: hypothetical protein D6800_00805 [candidate division Zixibacteria bacterium]
MPITPARLLWSNRPTLYRLDNNDFAPVLHRGDIIAVNSFAYRFTVPSFPFLHLGSVWRALPARCEIVRINGEEGRGSFVQVLGLPGETVGVSEGQLYVDGLPIFPCSFHLPTGEWPLTSVPAGSILVGTVKLGTIDKLFIVPARRLVGRARKLF